MKIYFSTLKTFFKPRFSSYFYFMIYTRYDSRLDSRRMIFYWKEKENFKSKIVLKLLLPKKRSLLLFLYIILISPWWNIIKYRNDLYAAREESAVHILTVHAQPKYIWIYELGQPLACLVCPALSYTVWLQAASIQIHI